MHTADRYAWTFYYDQFSPDNLKWDAQNFPVDGVIIAMGTNAAIICTEPVPHWVGADARSWICSTVAEMTQAGDAKLYFIPMNEDGPLLSESDYVGDNTHPTKEGSTKIATYLKDKIAAILGW